MLRISHRLLRYSGHIFQHKKNDVIIFQSYAIVSRGVKDDSSNSVSKLFQPATIKEIDVSQIGLELTGKINKPQLLNVLNTFSQKNEIINLCKEHGLDGTYFVRWIHSNFIQYSIPDMKSNQTHILPRLHSAEIVCKFSSVLLRPG